VGITVYWKFSNYKSDTQQGFTFHFNSNQKRLHDQTEVGEDAFAISGYQTELGFELFLLAHLVIRAKTFNPPNFKYGKHRIWADEKLSKYFQITKPLSPLLEKFDSIKQFKDDEKTKYAQAFQRIRKLSDHDTHLLKSFAKSLPIHPKTLYRFPEKEYEESLNQEHLLWDIIQAQEISEDSKEKFTERAPRNRALVKELNALYKGRCQLCSYDPVTYYGEQLCVAHHIVYFSRGGDDELSNLMLVCPNCHEAIHKTDAVYDFKDLTYKFDNGRISPLVINKHFQENR